MTRFFPNNTFVSNGRTYFFSATIHTNTEKYGSAHGLDFTDCVSFEYRNQINSFSIPAVLTYVDRHGVLDKYLEKPIVRCTIVLSNVKKIAKDDGIYEETLNEKTSMHLIFFVTKIEIVQREGKNVLYKIYMVSENWLNLMSTVNYTNYGKRPEQIFKIIKNIISQAELNVDDKTFDLVKSEVKLNYITNGNDTVVSAIKYLLSKMIYYKKFDEVWKFIYYDEQENKYKLFDLSNIKTCNGHRLINLSMFGSGSEELYQMYPIELYTVNSYDNGEVFYTGYGYKRTDYDYQHNIFVNDKIKNEDTVNLRNKSFIDFAPPFFQKYEKMFDSKLDFTHKVNYWNDNSLMSRYNNLTQTFCENNALVIKCSGEMEAKPSDAIEITLDRNVQGLTSEDPNTEDDIKHRYAGFEGSWITAGVYHHIDFSNQLYTTKLCMFRNFITDTIEKTAKE